jgi:DNA-binding transcriptional regulator YiaG
LGDHIRKRRLDLSISQAALAEQLGVNREAITNWEAGLQEPDLSRMPLVLDFLGQSLILKDRALAEQIRTKRRSLGLTQVEFGRRVGVSQETVLLWELGKREPTGQPRRRLILILET